jgi:hypothetical protein
VEVERACAALEAETLEAAHAALEQEDRGMWVVGAIADGLHEPGVGVGGGQVVADCLGVANRGGELGLGDAVVLQIEGDAAELEVDLGAAAAILVGGGERLHEQRLRHVEVADQGGGPRLVERHVGFVVGRVGDGLGGEAVLDRSQLRCPALLLGFPGRMWIVGVARSERQHRVGDRRQLFAASDEARLAHRDQRGVADVDGPATRFCVQLGPAPGVDGEAVTDQGPAAGRCRVGQCRGDCRELGLAELGAQGRLYHRGRATHRQVGARQHGAGERAAYPGEPTGGEQRPEPTRKATFDRGDQRSHVGVALGGVLGQAALQGRIEPARGTAAAGRMRRAERATCGRRRGDEYGRRPYSASHSATQNANYVLRPEVLALIQFFSRAGSRLPLFSKADVAPYGALWKPDRRSIAPMMAAGARCM